MAYEGLNCRASATGTGTAPDAAGETYVLGAVYPVARDGQTFGCSFDSTANTRDRTALAGIDRRLRGILFASNATPVDLRKDLSSTGAKTIRLAVGDLGSSGAQYVQLLDGGTVFATITGTTTGTSQFLDATGTAYPGDSMSGASWTALNTPITHTFTTTNFTLRIGDGVSGGISCLAHVGVDDAADTTAPTVTSASVSNSTPSVINLNMSETMDATSVPAASAYPVTGHTVSSVAISGTQINLTLATPFVYGEAARTVGYTQPGTNNARDLATPPNLLANFSGYAITNNVAAVAATGVTMTGPSTGVTGSPSSNFSVGVTPVGGTISGTLVVTPAAAGCTFSPTSLSLTTGSPTGTFTCTAAASGAKTVSATNNGSLTNPSNLTYTASTAAATATVVSGPSTGTAGSASTNFTASANGVITGTVVITPAATGCTFTPSTVSISSGSPTATFTCTAAASGAKTISFTNNGGLSNQANLTYTASAVGTVTIPPLVNNTDTPWASNTNVSVQLMSNAYPPTNLLTLTGRTTDSTGNLAAITNAALTVGNTVRAFWKVDSGDEGMMQLTVT